MAVLMCLRGRRGDGCVNVFNGRGGVVSKRGWRV